MSTKTNTLSLKKYFDKKLNEKDNDFIKFKNAFDEFTEKINVSSESSVKGIKRKKSNKKFKKKKTKKKNLNGGASHGVRRAERIEELIREVCGEGNQECELMMHIPNIIGFLFVIYLVFKDSNFNFPRLPNIRKYFGYNNN